jgi:hypothetical protein
MTGHTPAEASSSPAVKQVKRNGRPSQQQQQRLFRAQRFNGYGVGDDCDKPFQYQRQRGNDKRQSIQRCFQQL